MSKLNKYEKFTMIAAVALAPYFAINSPIIQNSIDSFTHDNMGTTLIQKIEDFRWNNLKEVALEGIDEKSFDGQSIKKTLNDLDTKEYKESLKNKDFYDLELQAFKDTKKEILLAREAIQKTRGKPNWDFEEEKLEPIKIDLKKAIEIADKKEVVEESEIGIKKYPVSMKSVHEARDKIRQKAFESTQDLSSNIKNKV